MKQTTELFDANTIRRALDGGVARRVAALEILEETASTNDYLLHKTGIGPNGGGFHVCLAATQTAGKGRRGGKVWRSPGNGNLYLSVMQAGADVGAPRSAWPALTAAGEVVSALNAFCNGAGGDRGFGVKWPNDVYCGGGKLAGILVEAKGERCVVGLGLNVHSPVNDKKEFAPEFTPEFTWAALDGVCDELPDRARLAAAMIAAIVRAFDRVARDSNEALRQSWRRHDLLSGREVTVLNGGEALTGVARGVDEHGGLRVEHGGGSRVYYSDEVSVRW